MSVVAGEVFTPSVTTWTNMPEALTFWNGVASTVYKVDTQDYREVRLTANVVTAGAAAAGIVVRCGATNLGTTAASWVDSPLVGDAILSVLIGTAGHKDTGWQMLRRASSRVRWFAILGEGGDGAVDPVIGGPWLAFR